MEQLGESEWRTPWAEGKWTVAELCEHLALMYEVALEELGGRGGAALRVSPRMATALRIVLLPHILFHRSIPVSAKAPREIRPTGRAIPREEMLELLADLSTAFLIELRKAHKHDERKLNHPYFGPIRPLQLLQFSTVHVHHHRRQLKTLLEARVAR